MPRRHDSTLWRCASDRSWRERLSHRRSPRYRRNGFDLCGAQRETDTVEAAGWRHRWPCPILIRLSRRRGTGVVGRLIAAEPPGFVKIVTRILSSRDERRLRLAVIWLGVAIA